MGNVFLENLSGPVKPTLEDLLDIQADNYVAWSVVCEHREKFTEEQIKSMWDLIELTDSMIQAKMKDSA